MLFKATICFQCSTTSSEILALHKSFSKELRRLQLRYNSHESDVQCSFDGGDTCGYIEVSFLVRREIHKVEAVHWLSMILQGLAGLHSVCFQGVDSFSYSYRVTY